jgi:hypothetical protein
VRVTSLLVLAGCGFQVAGSQARDAATGGEGAAIDAPTVLGDAPADAMIDAAAPLDLVIEAEAANQTTAPQSHAWAARVSVGGYSGASYMELVGGNGAVCPSVAQPTMLGCAAAMFYDVTVPSAATYTLWIRMWADGSASDSVYVTMDDMAGLLTQQVDVIEDQTWRWSASASSATFDLTAGPHRIGIWHREGGARVDKLGLTGGMTPPP